MAQDQFTLDDFAGIIIKAKGNGYVSGKHGLGKTEVIQSVVRAAGYDMFYVSLAMVRPEDFTMPVPGQGVIEWLPVKQLKRTNEDGTPRNIVIIFDEWDRGSVQVKNAAMEIVQQRTIMGEPINVQAVFAITNPGGKGNNYQVTSSDDAQLDRYFAFFMADEENILSEDYLLEKYGQDMVPWMKWRRTLDPQVKHYVTPRRIEKAFVIYGHGMPVDNCFPPQDVTGAIIPTESLKAFLQGKNILTLEELTKNVDKYAKMLKDGQEPELNVGITLIAKAITEKKVAGGISKAVMALPKMYRVALTRAFTRVGSTRVKVLEGLFPDGVSK